MGICTIDIDGKFGSRPSELETDSSPEIDSIGGNQGNKVKFASKP